MAGRILYRIVRGALPTTDDFRSHQQLERPLRDERRARDWSEGISAYASLDYAIAQARALRYRAGRFVVPLMVPDDGSVEAVQTGIDPKHHTIYFTSTAAQAPVCGPTVSAEQEPWAPSST